MSTNTKFLHKHENGKYYFLRKVPVSISRLIKQKQIYKSLKTTNLANAIVKSEKMNQIYELEWQHILANEENDEKTIFENAQKKAQSLNIKLLSSTELLVDEKIQELANRLSFIEQNKHDSNSSTSVVAIGAVKKAPIALKNILDVYFDEIKVENKKTKTPNQYRIWKNPKIKAVQNFERVNGEINFYDITRLHVNQLRSFWIERIINDEVKGNTAKKDFNNLSVVCDDYANHIGDFEYQNPFKNVVFDDTEDEVRPPFENEMIDDMLNSKLFLQLNYQARMAFFASLDTGVRPNEIARLKREHIILNENVPHIVVEPSKEKKLKTIKSRRKVPLVGIALEVFRHCPDGFPKYFHRENNLCLAINKFLKANGFKPTPLHTFTSLRHSFTDRMEEAGLGEEFRHRMTGHTNKHVVYGKGGSLEYQHGQLKKIERSFSNFLFEKDEP